MIKAFTSKPGTVLWAFLPSAWQAAAGGFTPD